MSDNALSSASSNASNLSCYPVGDSLETQTSRTDFQSIDGPVHGSGEAYGMTLTDGGEAVFTESESAIDPDVQAPIAGDENESLLDQGLGLAKDVWNNGGDKVVMGGLAIGAFAVAAPALAAAGAVGLAGAALGLAGGVAGVGVGLGQLGANAASSDMDEADNAAINKSWDTTKDLATDPIQLATGTVGAGYSAITGDEGGLERGIEVGKGINAFKTITELPGTVDAVKDLATGKTPVNAQELFKAEEDIRKAVDAFKDAHGILNPEPASNVKP